MYDPEAVQKVHEKLREISKILGELSEIPEEASDKLQKEITLHVEEWIQLTRNK